MVMLKAEKILMIGAAGKNAGKTEFVCQLIQKFKDVHKVFGLKVTTLHEEVDKGQLPPGKTYILSEETGGSPGKDTVRMLEAGAEKVFWLRATVDGLERGFHEFREYLSGNELVICESNSLRRVVEPGLFMIMKRTDTGPVKPTCQAVWEFADYINEYEDHRFSIPADRIVYTDPHWKVNDLQE